MSSVGIVALSLLERPIQPGLSAIAGTAVGALVALVGRDYRPSEYERPSPSPPPSNPQAREPLT